MHSVYNLVVQIMPKQKTKEKRTIRDIVYVIIWSAGLLFSSFGSVITHPEKFLLYDKTISEISGYFLEPLIFAIVLFLVDAIYNILKEEESVRKKRTLATFLGSLSLFFLGFLASMVAEKAFIAMAGFIVSWIFLTIMKFVSIASPCVPDYNNAPPVAQTPNND